MVHHPTLVAFFADPLSITIVGDFDMFGAEQLRSLLASTPSGIFTIDLARMRFIDAAGLGELVRTSRRHCLTIVNAGDRATRTFHLANLGNLLSG